MLDNTNTLATVSPGVNAPGDKVVSRKQAIRLGIKRYFTGKPCLRGHVSERYTSMAKCVACDNEDQKKHKPNE